MWTQPDDAASLFGFLSSKPANSERAKAKKKFL